MKFTFFGFVVSGNIKFFLLPSVYIADFNDRASGKCPKYTAPFKTANPVSSGTIKVAFQSIFLIESCTNRHSDNPPVKKIVLTSLGLVSCNTSSMLFNIAPIDFL